MESYRQSYYLENDAILYFGVLIFLEYLVLVLQGKPTPRFNDTVTSLSLGLFQECFSLAWTIDLAPLWNRLKCLDNWNNRIEALFKGPSWEPGSPWTGWGHFKKSITERPKYDVLIPRWKKYYIATHFFFLLANFQSAFLNENSEVLPSSYIFLNYVLTTLIVLSCLLDDRPTWICFVEFGRCAIFPLIQFPCFYRMGGIWYLQKIMLYTSSGLWGYLSLQHYCNFYTVTENRSRSNVA